MADKALHSIIRYMRKDHFTKMDTFCMNRFCEPVFDNHIFHSHDFVEICYVAAGSGFHRIENKEYKTCKGDLFMLNVDVCHSFYKKNDEDTLITYNILFKPGFIEQGLLDLKDFNIETLSYLFEGIDSQNAETIKLKPDIKLSTRDQDNFDYLLDKLYVEYSSMKEGSINIIKACVIELFVGMMRCFKHKSATDANVGNRVKVINEIVRHLKENFSERFSLEEIALKSFFSKNYLCKFFKNTTGMTISRYLQIIRIEEACRLLETTDKKITEISFDVGFNDYKYFFNTFKSIKGIQPHKYRKQCQ